MSQGKVSEKSGNLDMDIEWQPCPGSLLAAYMADLTLDLHTSLSQGSTSLRFHSRWSLSVNVFHDILGCPCPRFPSICMSQAVLGCLIATIICDKCCQPHKITPLIIVQGSSFLTPFLGSIEFDFVNF